MADSTITTYSRAPYVDNFNEPDPKDSKLRTVEEKNHLRILFKPGVSVQTRELNQLQSILQAQIDKLGRGVFEEGAAIIDGEKNFDDNVYAIDVEFDQVPSQEALDEFDIIYTKNPLNTTENPLTDLKAVVLRAEYLDAGNLDENTRNLKLVRFFVSYDNAVQDSDGNNVKEFGILDRIIPSEDIVSKVNNVFAYAGEEVATITNVRYAAIADVKSGVFFTKGEFVLAEEQTLYLIKPNKDYLINGKMAFLVEESIITAGEDSTLYDNASGQPNFSAPGADRYAINLNLKIISDHTATSEDDVAFLELNNFPRNVEEREAKTLGQIEKYSNILVEDDTSEFNIPENTTYSSLFTLIDGKVSNTTNDILGDRFTSILATRTSEESGDYAVKPFVLDIREFLNEEDNAENRGLYTPEQIVTLDIDVEEGDISGIEPGRIDDETKAEDVLDYGESRFVVGLEPSVAYVDGFRVEAKTKINLDVPKARTKETNVIVYSTAKLGNYVSGNLIQGDGIPNLNETVYIGGDKVGRVRSIEKDGDDYRLYLYDVVQQPVKNTVLTGESGFQFLVTSSLFETEYNRSLYDLPYDDISNVEQNTLEVVIREKFTGASVKDDQVLISIENAIFFEEEKSSYIVTNANTGAIIPVDNVILQTGTGSNSVILQFDNAQYEDTDPEYVNDDDRLDVILSYRNSSTLLTPRKKILNTIIDEEVVIDVTNDTFLDNVDIVDIVSIKRTVQNSEGEDEEQDITAEFELDNGQRAGFYGPGSLKFIGGSDVDGESVKVTYTFFARLGSGKGYYSAESYSTVDYRTIPQFDDNSLANVLDFRPDIDKDGNITTGTSIITLDPNSLIEAEISYYLSRIDIVIVNSFGEFKIIQGIPANEPVQPETPENAMLLYVLEVPAYTFDINEIEITYVDNKRYTMRDIGEIESRVKNLEYYTSLSLLEREANEKQIIGDSDFERFKNGILVDSFSGHGVGDTTDRGYICSIDKNTGILRAPFTEESVRLQLQDLEKYAPDDISTGLNSELALLPYSEEPFIEQLKASSHMSVNPYAVAAWWGDVKLSPSSDEWKETNQRPDVIINRENDAATLKRIADAKKAQGTIWGSWRTNWTGFRRENAGRKNGGFKCARMRRTGFCPNHGSTWTNDSTRRGIRTTASIETVRNVVNNKVIDTSFVPFIRSRRVYFKGQMFRPNTKLNIFFDDVDITQYATKIEKQDFLDNQFKKSSDVDTFLNDSLTDIKAKNPNKVFNNIVTDDAGEIYGFFVIPNNAALKFRTGEREVLFTDAEKGKDESATTTATVVYSAKGVMEHKQRTVVSTRQVRMTRERIQENRSTTFWRGNRWGPKQPMTLTSSFFTRWRDPLAQSFMIGDIETGLFATSIDLWFYKKSNNIPVQIYIVTTDNGYPSQEVVPFSEVTLNPDKVWASSQDASTIIAQDKPGQPTTFTFPTPVYLQPGVEYAVVVLSNDDNYRLWLSDVGQDDKATGDLIAKNPYTGVMFKSQNASTWTADQNKDFMFRFKRAKFETTTKELVFNTIGVDEESPYNFSQLSLISESVSFPSTDISYEITKNGGNSWKKIEISEDIMLNSGFDGISDPEAIKIRATVGTSSDYVSPYIDLDRISLASVYNDINSEIDLQVQPIAPRTPAEDFPDDPALDTTDTELQSQHGKARARYITRDVDLNNPADQLNVYLNINRPTNTSNVKVYVRYKTTDADIKLQNFKEILPSESIGVSSTRDDFSEVLFTDDLSDVQGINEFNGFQIKIVITSTQHWNIPTIKDLRAIATT